MTVETSPAPARPAIHPGRWIAPSAVGVLLAIGLLWAIRPDRYGCRASELASDAVCLGDTVDQPAVVAGVLLVALLAAIVVVATSVRGAARLPLLVVAVALLGIVALVAAAVSLSWTPVIVEY